MKWLRKLLPFNVSLTGLDSATKKKTNANVCMLLKPAPYILKMDTVISWLALKDTHENTTTMQEASAKEIMVAEVIEPKSCCKCEAKTKVTYTAMR